MSDTKAKEAPRYVASSDGEHYVGDEHDSREAAVEVCAHDADLEPGSTVWVGVPVVPSFHPHVGEWTLERIGEALADDVGEYAECFQWSGAEAETLNAAILRCLQDLKLWPPSCFSVCDVTQHVVPEGSPEAPSPPGGGVSANEEGEQ